MDCFEICAGAGGQAIGLELAGFEPTALVELDSAACATLRLNRPHWNVFEQDIRTFSASNYRGVDLLAGGVPCPPFSVAGKQLGADDERDLFPDALRLIDEARPTAVMLENVRGFLDDSFVAYRTDLVRQLQKLGYVTTMKLLQASDYNVSQLRPRVVIVALQRSIADNFHWPVVHSYRAASVGDLLIDLMAENQWELAYEWQNRAQAIAPSCVFSQQYWQSNEL